MPSFERVVCPCGALLLDNVALSGLVRVKCGAKGCKRRVWIAGDGKRAIVAMIDMPPKSRVG